VTVVPVHFPESGSIDTRISDTCTFLPSQVACSYGGRKLSRSGVPSRLEILLSSDPAQLEDELVLIK
jgi:hypothetical protein